MRSRFVIESLAFNAEQRLVGAGRIIIADFLAIAVSKIEFRQITMQVPLVTVLVDADHTALKDAVEALNSVGIDVHAGFAVTIAFRILIRSLF